VSPDEPGRPEAAAPPARPAPGTVSVIITVLRDPRVVRTIESLLEQRRLPDEIIVDDGGGTDEVRRRTEAIALEEPRVRYLLAPGNIAESRNRALQVANGELIAFLDADEVAPPEWLEELIAPFADPHVGFTGGPTPAMPESLRNRTARFYDGYLRRFYDVVARQNPHALPMGNSAWRSAVFRQVGALDTFGGARVGNEDQDAAVRAEAAGWRGVYVPSAPVLHDFSDIRLGSLWRKQRSYAEGGYAVWRRRKSTYEATWARVLPYAVLPAAAVLGAILAVIPFTRAVGLWLLGAALGLLVLLALILSAVGLRRDRKYPGLRYGALEIVRRWATLYGAFRGAVGATGKRGGAASPPKEPAPARKP
jgi:cellulose synthase/poly-beta-1,6-N-acetylglucosamine synthase-like glycosyltransferase